MKGVLAGPASRAALSAIVFKRARYARVGNEVHLTGEVLVFSTRRGKPQGPDLVGVSLGLSGSCRPLAPVTCCGMYPAAYRRVLAGP